MKNVAHIAKHLSLSMVMLVSTVSAQDFQDHDSIRNAAKTFLIAQAESRHSGAIEVDINPLDRRLKLASCDIPLAINLAPGAKLRGATSTRISCDGTSPWSLYVTGKIKVFSHTLVTKRALGRGERLSSNDVLLVEKDVSNLHYGYLSDAAQAIGQQTTRTLAAGQILTPGMIAPPRLIRRGDRVMLLAEIGGIEVSMLGEALNDGSQGQRLRVRALNSKRVIEGQVVSANVVKVTL